MINEEEKLVGCLSKIHFQFCNERFMQNKYLEIRIFCNFPKPQIRNKYVQNREFGYTWQETAKQFGKFQTIFIYFISNLSFN